MRISTPHQFDSFTNRLALTQTRLSEAQKRVMTGKRFHTLDEDPAAGMLVIGSRSIRSHIEQLSRNLQVAKGHLGALEVNLSEVSAVMSSAYQTAVRGANSTHDRSSFESLATEVEELQSRLLSLANDQSGSGHFIHAGHASNTRPFSIASGTLQFHGDTFPIQVEVKPGQGLMRVNLENADALFADAFQALESLRSNLRNGDSGRISHEDIATLKTTLEKVVLARGEVGNRLQTVESLTAQHERRVDDLTIKISDAEDIDIAEAITELKLAETTYQAALQVTAKGFQLSLMDFLR